MYVQELRYPNTHIYWYITAHFLGLVCTYRNFDTLTHIYTLPLTFLAWYVRTGTSIKRSGLKLVLWGHGFFFGVLYLKNYCIFCITLERFPTSWRSSWSHDGWIYNYLCNQCLLPLKLWVRNPLKRGVLDTTLCNKVCHWLVAGRWFSLGTPVSSTNKTDRHDITEIWLKVALDTITLTLIQLHECVMVFCVQWFQVRCGC